jgi:hypothetical protein
VSEISVEVLDSLLRIDSVKLEKKLQMGGEKLENAEKELKAAKTRLGEMEQNVEVVYQVLWKELDKDVKFSRATFLVGFAVGMCAAVWASILVKVLTPELD